MAENTAPAPDGIDPDVESNARLTATAGVVLVVLLALEGATILALGKLLPEHLFVGFLLIPPVLLKLASTGCRFLRYYTGSARYRRAGPPQLLLRLLAPLVVASTVGVFGTGVELWRFGYSPAWVTAHKLSFVLWFGATGVHVLAHLVRAPRLTLADLKGDPAVPGAITRRGLVGASLVLGLVLALATSRWASPFLLLGDG